MLASTMPILNEEDATVARCKDYKAIRNCAEYRWTSVPHNLSRDNLNEFMYDVVEQQCDSDYTFTRHKLYFKSENDAFYIKMMLPAD